MTETISAIKTKPTEIEFDVSVEGIKPNGMVVRMCIKTDKFDILLKCTNISKEKWKCIIPVLDFMDLGVYKFNIEAIVDGYFFDVTKGVLDISKSHEIYVKNLNTTVKPTEDKKKDIEKKEDVKKEESLSNKPSAVSIANSILKETKDAVPVNNNNDKATKLKSILEQYRRTNPVKESSGITKFKNYLSKGKQVKLR